MSCFRLMRCILYHETTPNTMTNCVTLTCHLGIGEYLSALTVGPIVAPLSAVS
jgi:hypothetical protein